MNNLWTSHEQVVNKSWTSHEEVLNKIWTSQNNLCNQQVVNKSWEICTCSLLLKIVHVLFMNCSWLIHDLFTTCLQFLWLVHDLFTHQPRYPDSSLEFKQLFKLLKLLKWPLLVHELLMTCSQSVHDYSTNFSLFCNFAYLA